MKKDIEANKENEKDIELIESEKKESNKDKWFGFTLFGRLIFTFYSFHGLLFVYNFVAQYILYVPGIVILVDNLFGKILLVIISFFFGLCANNILVIPVYECFTFPFLKYKNPLAHLMSFGYIITKTKFIDKDNTEITKKNLLILNIIFIIIEIFYFTGLIIELFCTDIENKVKDITKVVILFSIYLYYFLIIISYFFISLYLIVKLIIFSKKKNQEEGKDNTMWGAFKNIIKNGFYLNLFFEEENFEIPNINLINYAINPFLDKYYKFKDKDKERKEKVDNCYKCLLLFRIILILFSLIVFIIIFTSLYKLYWLSIFLFIFAFFVFSLFSIIMNFPCFWRSRKTYYCDFCCNEVQFDYHFKNTNMISFIRFINDLIIFILMTLITFWHLYQEIFKNNTPQKIEDFPDLDISQKKYNTKDLLLSNLCYNSVYNIPISLYLPFINDAYYYNEDKIFPDFFSSLQVKNYRNLFFDDDIYEINVTGLITKKNSNVKMVKYDVKNLKNEITILSIRGTFVSKDAFMDVQLYFPSVFLNILSSFSLFNKNKKSLSFRFIEYSLSIPYRIFFQYLIVENYLNDLLKAYYDEKLYLKKNIVIVGHSLGGGLAKIFGRLVKRQAISLSGPGINAFHSLWGYEGNSENFDVSVIDLIPDFDVVPRIEISGGTIHRIICKAGISACHGKERSLCEVLIMCRNPSYELYCKKMAKLNDKEINEILKSSELN